MLITSKRFDPISMAFGDAPRCRKCSRVPRRIEYARDIESGVISVAVICGEHYTVRSLDLLRIGRDVKRPMADAIVAELHRVFDAVLLPTPTDEPVIAFTEIVRRPITCGGCGAPSDPQRAVCRFCQARLAGVDR